MITVISFIEKTYFSPPSTEAILRLVRKISVKQKTHSSYVCSVTESLRLEKTFRNIEYNHWHFTAKSTSKSSSLSTTPTRLLNTFKVGDSTTSLGGQFQG